MAAARGFTVDGDEIGSVGQGLAHPGRESVCEQGRIDAVHQYGQPASAWHAVMIGQIAAQEVEMGRTPVGDQIVVVAVADRATDHNKQHLRQRMGDPPRFARIFDGRKMLQKRLQARLLKSFEGGNGHGRAPNQGSPMESDQPQPQKRVNPSS